LSKKKNRRNNLQKGKYIKKGGSVMKMQGRLKAKGKGGFQSQDWGMGWGGKKIKA